MGFFSEITMIEYFSCGWKHMIQRKCCMTSMIDQPRDTLWVILQCKSYASQFLFTHIMQRCSCICLQVLGLWEVCWPRKEVIRLIAAYCCGRTISTMGPKCCLWDFSSLITKKPLYYHFHRLFHVVDRSGSTKTGEWLSNHQLPQA